MEPVWIIHKIEVKYHNREMCTGNRILELTNKRFIWKYFQNNESNRVLRSTYTSLFPVYELGPFPVA